MSLDDHILETGTFDPTKFADELGVAPANYQLGPSVWFENERIRVWEVLLEPGERGPFHNHTTKHFWTVVEAGKGLQRFADGTYAVRDYRVGDTRYLENTPDDSLIHDLENVGGTRLRFVTVEILS